MGLTLEFLLGNDKKIIKAAKKADYDLFDETGCILNRADFSLHITPKDLNTLSMVASKYNNLSPLGLREQLVLIINEVDHGLFGINSKWIEYFSQVSKNDLEKLTQTWFDEMRKQYPNEEIEVTQEGVKAVIDLNELCKYAITNKKEVYHFWVG
jgi:predicted GTPase